MSTLFACPVIAPPRPGLLDSWTATNHLVIVNGADHAWPDHDRWHTIRPGTNLGCPTSWNLAARHAIDHGYQYLCILSQGTTIRHGTAHVEQLVERHADDRGLRLGRLGFHAYAIHLDRWNELGGFDEGLPIYCDIDWIRRLHLAGHVGPHRPHAHVPLAADTVRRTAVEVGAIDASAYTDDLHRYIHKWGGPPCRETRGPPTPTNV